MTPEMVLDLAQNAVFTILLVAGPMLLMALGVGLLVSIFQATTQIQEQTLAFIPKIVAVLLSLVIFGPWMLSVILDFTNQLWKNLHLIVG
ncbi:flagellar biosynthetic protein FliQ [Caldalkalibacillus thermarum TA2.A1]|uniref:Flagellar biosynthetic protein FliQ n=1 Tax=Caldalkalibacillus thermarum (strain TA2.A1) TaxID=986075 RepID=F5L802_CALTT|nr:flagellar biosynthesis protein FliQ [Caldalkalibacillus thermarum]EGL82510.1 flagellar biosynthetic protein FliQ [Caldalkalibacillus thermarum TA2.A1]QZT35423.1 flagellar biosynthesis protein FliQ [Caldalkalibacillus thermarum TA2.A1]